MGFRGLDEPYRVRRVSKGLITASGVVFISEMIVRMSKRLITG